MQPSRRALILAAPALLSCVLAGRRAEAEDAPYAGAAAWSTARRGVSLLIEQDGEVVFEDYPAEGGADRAWELASGTKSFSGVLAAALVQDGLLRLDEACADTLTEWRADAAKRAVTVRQLLTLTGGVGRGAVGRPEPYAVAAAAPLDGPPGERFRYGPRPFQTFGEIVRRKLRAAGGSDDVYAYLDARILTPIGVRPGFWRRQDGQPNLPSGARLTARDWARFGRFVLNGGVANGRRLADAATLAACFEGTAANPGYGLTWWLLRPGLVAPGPNAGVESAPAVAAMADVRMAAGAGHQRLYLIPERRMVIVRQASGVLDALTGRGPAWSDATFLSLVLGTDDRNRKRA